MVSSPSNFRLALKARAITFYEAINTTEMGWVTVQSKFCDQFMSCVKKAEISAELDSLLISFLRTDEDTNWQSLYKLFSRLDKLSLMDADDDRKDDPNICRLHNAIAQEEWNYFLICKVPVEFAHM